MVKLSDVIRSADVYGQTVSVNFNGDTSYKSTFGGILSILSLVIVVLFGVERGLEVKNGQSPTITYNQVGTDVVVPEEGIKGSDSNFGVSFWFF